MVEKNVAIIPARGGSKRIPHKNIFDFLGKPMISYTIEAALQSRLYEKVIVSTDSIEIAEIARNFGADVPFMRIEHADDYSSVSEVIIHALIQTEEYYKTKYDVVTSLMPNCPLRNANDIKSAMKNFSNNKCLSQISCFRFGFMNPWWAFKMNTDFSAEWVFDNIKKRSQDLQELFCPTGAIWISQTEYLKKHNSFYSPEVKFFEMDWKTAIDIDNYEDIEIAKIIYATFLSSH
jgi:N-acylneuraminate cytidylyltransferase